MKKILYTATLILMAAMTLTSCIGGPVNKHERKEQLESQKEAYPTTVIYTVKCSQDLVDAIDLVVKYKDKGGINATDTIRDTLWTKTVTNDYLPVKIGLDWSVAPKPADKINKETFDNLSANYEIQQKPYRLIDGNFIVTTYRNFPASKLADLCDYVNYEQNIARTHDDWHFPCYMLGRLANDLVETSWDD